MSNIRLALSNRPDTEHEQALLRVFISLCSLIYFAAANFYQPIAAHVLISCVVYVVFCCSIVGWILFDQKWTPDLGLNHPGFSGDLFV